MTSSEQLDLQQQKPMTWHTDSCEKESHKIFENLQIFVRCLHVTHMVYIGHIVECCNSLISSCLEVDMNRGVLQVISKQNTNFCIAFLCFLYVSCINWNTITNNKEGFSNVNETLFSSKENENTLAVSR